MLDTYRFLVYNVSLYGGIMGNFLLNELGEGLLEIQSHLDFGADMCLEVYENKRQRSNLWIKNLILILCIRN
mgnify:CR=1 FL=1